jgi:protein involved in polysaccharide export with SLBB domain
MKRLDRIAHVAPLPARRRVTARCQGVFMRGLIASGFAALLLGGCGQWDAHNPTPPQQPPSAAYLINVGDTLDIRFYNAPDLNMLALPVRSDGKISVDLLGDVQAAGMEPAQLARALSKSYGRELTDPRIAVIVRSFGGQVYVDGQVGSPSMVPYATGMTVLQSVAAAGGFLESAKVSSVILIRRNSGQYEGYRLGLQDFLEGKDPTADAPLQPSDIVFVPRSVIANVNQFVKMYIRNNLPIPLMIPIL